MKAFHKIRWVRRKTENPDGSVSEALVLQEHVDHDAPYPMYRWEDVPIIDIGEQTND